MMDVDSCKTDANEEQSQVAKTDDSCIFEFIEIVPLARDTHSSYTTEHLDGDWSGEVKQENFAVVKQEPDDVCCGVFILYSVYHGRNISAIDIL